MTDTEAHAIAIRPAWNHFVRIHRLDRIGTDYVIDMRTRWWWEVLGWFGVRLTPGRYRMYLANKESWVEVPNTLLDNQYSDHLAALLRLQHFTDVVTFLRHWEVEHVALSAT